MTRSAAHVAVFAGASGLLGGSATLFVHGAGLVSALLVAGLAVAAVVTSVHVTSRAALAAVAGLIVSLWEPAHLGGPRTLLGALAPAAALWFPTASNALAVPIAALAAGGAGFAIGATPIAATLAGALAGIAVVARPQRPTGGQIRSLRTVSLFLPAALLFAALAVNAVTGRAEALTIREALTFGVGLAGLLGLVALAGLGMTTLLESDDPAQGSAWVALAIASGLVVASLLERDPSRTIRVSGVLAVPVGVLGSLAVGRLRTDGPEPVWLVYLGVGLLVLAQLGLQIVRIDL